MRIKQLHVTRYGPMAPFARDDLGSFTLFHGPNENGKTLLIDALIRLLFKKELRRTYRRRFGTDQRNMNRVAENPEGFVVLETQGAEYKLDASETVKDVYPFPVVPDDFRNVFVVRDSDLSLAGEDKYYSRVTEKLTGLRSSEIEKLMRAIQKRGRLRSATADSALANSAEQGKIADKVKEARALIDEIHEVKQTLLAEQYDELEGDMIAVRDRLAVLAQEAELMRAAEVTKRFRKARRALDDFRRMSKRVASLDHLDSDQLRQWQRAATRRETLEADVAEEKKEAEKVERAARNARKAVTAGDAKAAEAQERLNRINSELRPRIDDYQYERADFRRAEPQFGTYRKGLYAAAAIALLGLLGYIVRPSEVIAGLALAALLVWLFLGWKQMKLRMAEGRLRSKRDRLEADIKHCGIEVESVDEVMSTIGDVERKVLSQQQDVQARRADLEHLIKEKERIEARIADKSEQMAELDGELAALKAASQMDSLGGYQAAMEKRTKIAAAAEAKRTILADLLPTDRKGDEALEEWENRITTHLQAAEGEERIEFNAEAMKRVKAELDSLEERQRQIQSALLKGSRRLHGVEVKAKELGVLETSPPCRTTQELDHIGALLEQFCHHIEYEQRVAQDAIAICARIEDEERSRVSDLFGAQSPVTAYVAAITGGRYVSVEYDAGRNQVYLTTADGGRVPADFLSGGAYDQLYLAIRVTIATRLLAEEKGFLILDDPFVKADPVRLDGMMGMLRGLVDDGWQILYFSAKEEVERALAGDVRDGRVQLVRLQAPAAEAPSEEDDRSQTPGPTQGDLALRDPEGDAGASTSIL
jgi:DNA repair exonuclease SbcCD ATPase subunit